MTTNKDQGQTLDVAVIDLSGQCFSHGQLYIALSRVTSKSNMYIFAPPPNLEEGDNIVYKEIVRIPLISHSKVEYVLNGIEWYSEVTCKILDRCTSLSLLI
ncbi:ATP-dependent DNA helicase PIF6-like [Aphis craccivora]|uniref:ATP-dependent DNA helicase PIF6-like n=1 Tax=Aphis craccivora TaxID=307492 RepID=A0A6G0YQ39_APHCR|nr:ATP-dependent DNA helicase PIF6-like [Aphis craccivora]